MIVELLFLLGINLLSITAIRRYAPILHLVDFPNVRSFHNKLIPRGAGIAFVSSALADLAIFHHQFWTLHWPILVALALVLAIGILDDRHDAAPWLKFVVIVLATLVLWDDGLLIDHVGKYFGIDLRLAWLALPFTLFAVAGFTNALNLIDGLDGLAGSLSLTILFGFYWLGAIHGDTMLTTLSLAFGVGVAVFLIFNWHPASIFMGDSGSLTLGFLISLLSIRALEYLPSVSVLYIGAVPLIDTLTAIIRRKRHGRSAMAPDRCHIHHLLVNRTNSVTQAVVWMVQLQLAMILVGLFLSKTMDQTLPLVLFGVVVWGVYHLIEKEIRRQGIDCYQEKSTED
jgi:UDP-GlcNAc:undecaprenyl-phosphate GlcNAc-1-phosphate transferase